MSGSRWIRTGGSAGLASRSKITASDSLASTNTPRTKISFWSGCDAGQRQHRMHQCVGARGAIGLRGVFEFVVADAVLAGHEDHRRRHHVGKIAGVMSGAGSDAAMGIAERLGCGLYRIDQLGVEYGRR